MKIARIQRGQKPLITPTGEIIYELFGRKVEPKNTGHSLAQIILPSGTGSAKHYHPEFEESYYMLSGSAEIILGEERATLQTGDAVIIPPHSDHKIWNKTDQDVVFIAICVPAWSEGGSVYRE